MLLVKEAAPRLLATERALLRIPDLDFSTRDFGGAQRGWQCSNSDSTRCRRPLSKWRCCRQNREVV